jgi:polyferredoxin
MRPKILGYMGILLTLLVVLIMMGSDKEYMLLNINKENRLYSITKTDEGKPRVENAYTFLLQNTLAEDHKYYFDIITPKGMEGKIKIDTPTEPFNAKPGVVKKKVVVLYADEMIVNNPTQDTIIPITIKAYAIDNKEEVVVLRESTFTYPRADLVK